VSIILILGGARSGKSRYAQELAEKLGRKVLYVATAEALDDEMKARIEAHRRSRPSSWKTVEAASNVAAAIADDVVDADVVIIDCLTLLLSNVADEDAGVEVWEKRAAEELDRLVALADGAAARFIVVSNEVGLGLVPAYPLGRGFRDVVGWANQMLARRAAEVYFMVAGIPLKLKKEDDA
jgi:adenosylcobinamide kinase/adenosylcobinamide-phosphate guanylyltransferase